MDQLDSLLKQPKEQECDEEKPVVDDKNLDMLNFHIKEMRQPKWTEVSKTSSAADRGQSFNRSYLPSG